MFEYATALRQNSRPLTDHVPSGDSDGEVDLWTDNRSVAPAVSTRFPDTTVSPLLRVLPLLLLLVTACTTEATLSSSEDSAPEQEETLSTAAETWCAEHFGAVTAAAARMPRGLARFEMIDRTPPAVQAAKSLDRPPERIIEIWKDVDLPSWKSNCTIAYSALGDLDEGSWRFCHDNASLLGSAAYSMGLANVVSGSLRDDMESDIDSTDEEVRGGGYSRLALYVWLVDFGQWEEACREALQPDS